VTPLRQQLTEVLRVLEARILDYPEPFFIDRGRARGRFALALSARRRAIKPVERLSARIAWANLALELLNSIDKMVKEGRDRWPETRVQRNRRISRRVPNPQP
jgi:hypothetical protein